MYTRGLIPRISTELAEVVRLAKSRDHLTYILYGLSLVCPCDLAFNPKTNADVNGFSLANKRAARDVHSKPQLTQHLLYVTTDSLRMC